MRQKLRNTVILMSLLAFPLTMNYFSPYLSVHGAALGVLSGSLALFGLMFVSSLILGRGFCGWVCPAGCLQDIAMKIEKERRPRHHWIKYLTWLPWFSAICILALRAGGFKRIDLLFMMDSAVSVAEPANYFMYYTVLILILVLALASGRHAFCHYGCWMAPFMIIGRKLRNAAGWPSLQLKAQTERCIQCGTCTGNCPMSINVQEKVQTGDMEHSDCILCGQCIDNCQQKVIAYSFESRKRKS